MNDRVLLLPLAVLEGVHLARLVDEFRELLAADAAERAGDPALARLTPSPYPDDAEAAQAFADAAQDELLDRRAADAAVVRAELVMFDVDPSSLSDDDALAPRDVVIRQEHLDAWLRTLSALRLVIASRLGIETDDDIPADDPRRGVYDWLGYRLEGLIEMADDAE